MRSLPLSALSLLAGVLWGVLAYALGRKAFGPAIQGGVLAAPFIGLAVGRIVHPFFSASRGIRRAFLSLVSLYAGSLLFGLAVGIGEAVFRPGGRDATEVIAEAVIAVLWGVTMTGYFVALWPMAHFTHWAVEHLSD